MSSDGGAVALASRNAEPAVYVENMYNSCVQGAPQSLLCRAGAAGWEAGLGRSSREVRRVVIERGPSEQIGIQLSPAPAPAPSPPTSTPMTDASNAGTGTGTSVAAGDSASSVGDGCCCGASSGGVFVAHVLVGSLAERAGLEAGDQLLEVCGINLRNAQLTVALQILRQCTETVELLVQYNPGKLLALAADQTAMQHNNNSLSAPSPNPNPNPNAIPPPPHRSRSDSSFEQTQTQAANLPERLKRTPKQQLLVPELQQQQTEQQTEQMLPNLSSPPRRDACTATPESVECWQPTSRAVLCRSGSSRSVRSLQRNRQQHRNSVLSSHTRILEDSSESNDFRVTLFTNREFRKLTN